MVIQYTKFYNRNNHKNLYNNKEKYRSTRRKEGKISLYKYVN